MFEPTSASLYECCIHYCMYSSSARTGGSAAIKGRRTWTRESQNTLREHSERIIGSRYCCSKVLKYVGVFGLYQIHHCWSIDDLFVRNPGDSTYLEYSRLYTRLKNKRGSSCHAVTVLSHLRFWEFEVQVAWRNYPLLLLPVTTYDYLKYLESTHIRKE
jgi:hypothetical protein